ncbi:beta-1,3-glucan-binding protein-like [Anopheles aquasalis]|uniref:beta-1,3-glucan-binding protein-like n=1 Tax=Anopheles aquasalis TaxID=42839 RepID=UPI00215A916E|nr:beta-1,3-glucan-binding protein-like [Anopheles aquasalis]
MEKFLHFLLPLFSIAVCNGDPRRVGRYQPPKPRFEVFDPQGLIVWINADPGISSFTFHGKLNQQFSQSYDVGRWAQTITKVKNGRYLLIDREAKLVPGDTIYYRTIIVRNGQTYRTSSGTFTVRELRPASTTPAPATGLTFRSGADDDDDDDDDYGPFVQGRNDRRTKEVRSTATQTEVDNGMDGNCSPGITTVNGRAVCSGQLLFEDQFNGRALDQRKWRLENRFASEPDNEFVVYADFKENSYLKSGNLAIRPTLFEDKFGPGSTNNQFRFADECTGDRSSRDCIRDTKIDFDMIPPILTAQVSTINSFRFTYGKVVIRAKLPQGNWIFPQLYLVPSTDYYGRDRYASGLMRLAFVPGGPRLTNQLSGGLLISDTEPLRCAKMCTLTRDNHWNADYHEYGLRWTPEGVWMEVDGEVYCFIDPGEGFYRNIESQRSQTARLWRLSGNRMAPFDKDFHVVLGVGVGGHYDFHQFGENKPWKDLGVKAMFTFWKAKDRWQPTWRTNNTLMVDYVRVYGV